MRALLLHWPHVLPVLLGFGAVVYLYRANTHASRPATSAPARQGDPPAPIRARAPRRDTVAREAARRGVLVLGPALAAIATGAAIYGIDLAGEHPGRGVAWVHAGVGILVCMLGAYKLAALRVSQVRREWRVGRTLAATGSAVLTALLVPLLATGVALLAAPSSDSFTAYLHLIASAWWTALVLWHLRRYLWRSLAAVGSGGVDTRPTV